MTRAKPICPHPRRRCLHWLAASGLAASAPALAQAGVAVPVWRSRFESGLADWPGLSPVWGRHNQSFVRDAGVLGQALRIELQKGGIDPGSMRRRGLPESGTGFKARVWPAGLDVATLRYRLRFAEGFDFVRGGKLPGLYGGIGHSGGRMPSGSDGFSLRLMWRRHGLGEVYAYLPTSVLYGTSLLPGRLRFVPGQWHALVQEVGLNTPGLANGWLRLWQDRQLVGEAQGLRMRDISSLKLDGVFVDVFFGGNDDSWAPAANTHLALAEFELLAGAVGSA